jgi:hypothetical protein
MTNIEERFGAALAVFCGWARHRFCYGSRSSFRAEFGSPPYGAHDAMSRLPAYHVVPTPAPIILVAIAADALVNAVVSSSDPAVEVRGGRALRRARTGYGLSRRSQIILIQKSCGFVPGGRASAGLSLNHSDSGDSRAQERNKKRFHHSILRHAERSDRHEVSFAPAF